MEFTFGIVTDGENTGRISNIIDSIELLGIPNYEIIIIGGTPHERKNTRHIQFNEDSGPASLTKKKNIITENANLENIVYLHDYIAFNADWYTEFIKFGNNFNVCMNQILNNDGTRYRDWCLWCDDGNNYVKTANYLIPYDMVHLSGMMYISGAYWVAKKEFMLKNPLNEILKWGQGEDVEWSLRVRNHTEFKINVNSIVKLIKHKDRVFNETTDAENLILNSIGSYQNKESYSNLIKNHLNKWIK
jgi:hypothetical protein